jgi:hypothetical protein
VRARARGRRQFASERAREKRQVTECKAVGPKPTRVDRCSLWKQLCLASSLNTSQLQSRVHDKDSEDATTSGGECGGVWSRGQARKASRYNNDEGGEKGVRMRARLGTAAGRAGS